MHGNVVNHSRRISPGGAFRANGKSHRSQRPIRSQLLKPGAPVVEPDTQGQAVAVADPGAQSRHPIHAVITQWSRVDPPANLQRDVSRGFRTADARAILTPNRLTAAVQQRKLELSPALESQPVHRNMPLIVQGNGTPAAARGSTGNPTTRATAATAQNSVGFLEAHVICLKVGADRTNSRSMLPADREHCRFPIPNRQTGFYPFLKKCLSRREFMETNIPKVADTWRPQRQAGPLLLLKDADDQPLTPDATADR